MQWCTAFTIWLATQGIPVDGVSGQGTTATIWYRPAATQQQIATAEAAKASFVVPAQPDPSQAETAIAKDSRIAPSAMLEVLKYKSLLESYPGNAALIQMQWALIKAHDAAIDSVSAAAIESDCVQANMPLI